MTTRRETLLGLVAGAAGLGVFSNRTIAWYYEDLTPDQAAAFAAACRAAPANAPEDHAQLVSNARRDLVHRIARGLLPIGSSERVACPFCGCSFMVTADGTN